MTTPRLTEQEIAELRALARGPTIGGTVPFALPRLLAEREAMANLLEAVSGLLDMNEHYADATARDMLRAYLARQAEPKQEGGVR